MLKRERMIPYIVFSKREQGVLSFQHLQRHRRQRRMKTFCVTSILCACFTALAWGADPALTIYNQNFAVIRETLPLDLKSGNNTVRILRRNGARGGRTR